MRTDNAIPLDAAPSLDGALILIVDDQEEARMLLRLALEACGAQAMAVSSGLEALAVLSDPPGGVQPDALILDIGMKKTVMWCFKKSESGKPSRASHSRSRYPPSL